MHRIGQYESPSRNVNRFLWLADRIGAAAAFVVRLFRPRSKRDATEARKILLVRCDGIGDVVNSEPAIRAVREQLPNAEVHLVVGPWARDVAGMIEGVDRIATHAPWGYRVLRKERGAIGPWEDLRFARRMRSERYNVAVDLRGDLLSLVPLSLWRIPVRIGRTTRGGAFAVTHPIEFGREETVHEIDRTIAAVGPIAGPPADRCPRLNIPRSSREAAERVLEQQKLDPERTVLFVPGAQWRWRQWPVEHFSGLADRLVNDGYSCAVVGSEGDAPLAARIDALAKTSVADLTGATSLPELAALFHRCAGFVAVESGPAHVAAAVGARGVVLFGPGVPERFGPRTAGVATLHRPCDVHPCYQRGDCQRPNTWCMQALSISEVRLSLLGLLGRAAGEKPG